MQLTQDQNSGVIIINETKLIIYIIPIKVSGYHIFRKDRQTSSEGAAILVTENINAQEVTIPKPLQEPISTRLLIAINHHPDPIYITTLYPSPPTDINNSFSLFQHLEQFKNMIIIADLNRDRKTNENCKLLFQCLLQACFINVNMNRTRFVNNIETAPERILISRAISNKN